MNIWSSIDCNECTDLTNFFKKNVSKTKKRRNREPLIKKRRRNRKPDLPWQTGEGATLEQRRLIAETAFCVMERLRENDVFFLLCHSQVTKMSTYRGLWPWSRKSCYIDSRGIRSNLISLV